MCCVRQTLRQRTRQICMAWYFVQHVPVLSLIPCAIRSSHVETPAPSAGRPRRETRCLTEHPLGDSPSPGKLRTVSFSWSAHLPLRCVARCFCLTVVSVPAVPLVASLRKLGALRRRPSSVEDPSIGVSFVGFGLLTQGRADSTVPLWWREIFPCDRGRTCCDTIEPVAVNRRDLRVCALVKPAAISVAKVT